MKYSNILVTRSAEPTGSSPGQVVGVLYFVWAVHAGDVHTLLTALQLGFKAAIRFWMMAAALSRFDMLEFIGGHYGLWWKQGERGHSSDIHAWRHNEARAGPVMTEETHGSATIDLHLPVSTTNWCVEIKKDQLLQLGHEVVC